MEMIWIVLLLLHVRSLQLFSCGSHELWFVINIIEINNFIDVHNLLHI